MKLFIAGSGAAGNTAAFVAREIDPSLSVTIFSEDGLPFYSPCLLPQYLASSLSRKKLFINDVNYYSKKGIEFLPYKITEIDLHKHLVKTEVGTFDYDRLILAMGAQPKWPIIEGIDLKGLFSLKTLKDSDGILSQLGPKAAVVGSGNIGIEAALALRNHGCEVMLFESETTVNPIYFPPLFSNLIQEFLESMGVKVVTNSHITKILGETAVKGLEDRGIDHHFETIINATGTVPNVGIARQAGITIGPKGGILVDHHLRTSNPFVYACGDCVELYGDDDRQKSTLGALWPNAVHQGRVAGYNAANHPKRHHGLFNFRILKLKDNFAISLGLSEKDLAILKEIEGVEGNPSSDILMRIYTHQGRIVAARLWGKAWKLGPFISCIQRNLEVEKLSTLTKNHRTLSRYPFLGQVRFFFPKENNQAYRRNNRRQQQKEIHSDLKGTL